MKRIIAILIIGLCASFASAQSVQLIYNGQPLNNEDTIYMPTSVDQLSQVFVGYSNITSQNVFLKVKRRDITFVPGDALTFCVGGTCVEQQSGEFELPAGATVDAEDVSNGSFHADYTCHSQGTSVIKFTFYNTEDPSDEVNFYVYASTALGVSEHVAAVQAYAYPNPATTTVNIRYKVENPQGANLVIRNILGGEVYSQAVQGEGRAVVSTSDLAPGIYVYGIEEKGRMLVTKKLLVK